MFGKKKESIVWNDDQKQVDVVRRNIDQRQADGVRVYKSLFDAADRGMIVIIPAKFRDRFLMAADPDRPHRNLCDFGYEIAGGRRIECGWLALAYVIMSTGGDLIVWTTSNPVSYKGFMIFNLDDELTKPDLDVATQIAIRRHNTAAVLAKRVRKSVADALAANEPSVAIAGDDYDFIADYGLLANSMGFKDSGRELLGCKLKADPDKGGYRLILP